MNERDVKREKAKRTYDEEEITHPPNSSSLPVER
jgi:hypothetical protein